MLLAISNVTKHVIPGCYFECSMPYYFEASFLHEDPGHEQLTFNRGLLWWCSSKKEKMLLHQSKMLLQERWQ